MLVTAMSNESISAGQAQTGVIACKTLNGIYLKTSASATQPYLDFSYNVTANGNTILNSIIHSGLYSLQAIINRANNYKVIYLPFGAVPVGGAVEVEITNNETSSATFDVAAEVDRPGSVWFSYAKYRASTFTSKNVTAGLIVSDDGTNEPTSTSKSVTLRAGSQTQSLTFSEMQMMMKTSSKGDAINYDFGLVYRGAPTPFNLTGSALQDDQFYVTQNAWKV